MLYFIKYILLTILFESGGLFVARVRDKQFYVALAIINIPSNLTANFIDQILRQYNWYSFGVVLIIELLVVAVEYSVLKWVFSKRYTKIYLIKITLFVNALSFGIGLISM